MRASGEFDVRTVKSASAVEVFTKRIADQKVHLGEAIKQRKLFNKVVEEQLALQRAQAVSWKQLPDGRLTADLIMPKDAAPRIMKTRMQVSVLNELIKSSADNMVKWGKNTQWAGRQLTVGFSVPMAIAAAATGKLAYEVDKSLTQITKVYGDANSEWQATTESLRKVSLETAQNMASTYGQSAKDTLEITAQFAAAGKTGTDLQNATAAATRARTLNELDLQTAIQASITLQTVYGHKAKELGEDWDYINAVANQTVLGAEDFAVAIPKVAGVINELGGSLKDVGTLLTAFKAAGIDAAEGANALKTISFRAVAAYGRGLQTFEQMTGQNLKAIVKQTNGETIPTLLAMYKAMENLSAPQRIAVVKDVFGIYQGNKALMLMEQLAGASDQVAQAMAVGDNSIAENAKIANQELDRMNAQPFKRIQKAVASLQLELANIGKSVLPIVADTIETVTDLLSGRKGLVEAFGDLLGHFADLPGKIKLALVVGLAGPVTMLAGLFVNLVGNIMKFSSALGTGFLKLSKGYRLTTAEERTQMLVAKQAGSIWDQQAAAAAALTLELRKMNAAMAESSRLNESIKPGQIGQMGPMRMYENVYQDPSTGRWRNTTTGRMVKGADVDAEAEAAGKRARASYAESQALAQRNAQYKELSRNIGTAAAAGGLLATVFGGGDGVVGQLGEAALLLGTITAIFPSMGASVIRFIVEPFRNMAKNIDAGNGRLATMKTRISGIGSGLKSLGATIGGPLLIALTAVLAIWNQVHDSEQKSLEKAKAYADTAKTLADLTGTNYTESSLIMTRGQSGAEGGMDEGAARASEIAQKFRQENAVAADELARSGRETGDAWGEAIAQGVQVRLHGGTVQAARDATRAALELMGQRFKEDAQFEVQINGKVNFDDVQSMVDAQMENVNRHLQNTLNDNGEGFWQGFSRKIFQNDDLTARSSEIVKQQAKKMADLYLNASEDQRPRILSEIQQATDSGMTEMFNEMMKQQPERMKKLGIKTVSDLQNAIQDKKVTRGMFDSMIASSFKNIDYNQLAKSADQNVQAIRKIALELGLYDEANIKTLDSWQQLMDAIARSEGRENSANQLLQGKVKTQAETNKMLEEYGLALDRAAQQGKTLDAQDKLAIVNQIRLAHGYDYVTSATNAFANSQSKAAASAANLAEVMEKLNFNPAISPDQVTSTYKSALTGTMDDLFKAASDQADSYDNQVMDALDARMDAALKSYDDKSDALQDKFDKQKDAFDKKWEDRKQRESDYYDNRINKVQAAIDAEQKAEEIRQRIYEAEKARIERMATLYNKNIDFNTALNTGNLDEAAKISNDMRAQTEQWMTDDALAASGDASKTRTDALNKQKDSISEAKDARMKALDDIKDAEEDALKHSQDMAKKRLDAEKDATRQYYENQKKTNQAILDDKKRKLQIELDNIRAFIPRNESELRAQAQRIDDAYKKYGVKLNGYGKSWSQYIGDQMNINIKRSGESLRSDVAWTSIGTDIASGLLKGGFGMTPKQFAAWLNGGDAPAGSVFAPTAAYKRTKKQQEAFDLRHQGRHKGGIIGRTGGDRTGYSGRGQAQSETWINALYGESVLNRKATDAIGEENINALNKGKLPKNTGPWGLGGIGPVGIGAALAAGAVKNAMAQTLMGLAVRRMQQMDGVGEFTAKAGSAGKYGGISLSQEQLNNAATIMGVGRSMGASERDLIIGIMTAMQESTLRNLTYGDRDSLGLFQQRPSQGWGTAAQVSNTSYASRKFFEHLLGIKNRGNMPLTMAAQAVQRSAYPEAYAKWEAMARAIVGKTSIIGNQGIYRGLGRGINLGQYGMAGAGGSWVMPASGPITSHYGMRVNPVTGAYKLHAGSDIGAGFGAAIHAAKSGRVVSVQTPGQSGGYGNYTIIDHGNGIRTAYAHQSQVLVSPGQMVSAGQTIGKVGSTGNSTGPHLHFEYMKNGQRLNPNQIIPSLNVGGWAMSDGLARLHKDEPVLTKPLGADLKEGLNKFANGDLSEYTVKIDLRGSVISADVDIERAVNKALDKRESKLGRSRRIGNS